MRLRILFYPALTGSKFTLDCPLLIVLYWPWVCLYSRVLYFLCCSASHGQIQYTNRKIFEEIIPLVLFFRFLCFQKEWKILKISFSTKKWNSYFPRWESIHSKYLIMTHHDIHVAFTSAQRDFRPYFGKIWISFRWLG